MQFIDLKTQYRRLESEMTQAIHSVLEHGQYIMGPEVRVLEAELAEFTGAQFVVSNSSGTDALLMALMALGVGPGDEVITSAFSFFASAEVILLCQAKPILVDIDPKTYNMDVNQLEKLITARTKAIMPVSLYGQCADMNKINEIAARHGLPVIEDAAQSFGALYQGKMSCNLSTIGCTSFFPSKPLGGYGDSGACFTNDADLAQALREIRHHGESTRYSHERLGMNGRMDTLQAAILSVKLKVFAEEMQLRQEVAARYGRYLDGLVKIPNIMPGATSAFAQYTIEVPERQRFQKTLQEKGIPTAIHYPKPIHQQKIMQELTDISGPFPHTERASRRVISLPMHPYLTDETQQQIVEVIQETLEQIRKEPSVLAEDSHD